MRKRWNGTRYPLSSAAPPCPREGSALGKGLHTPPAASSLCQLRPECRPCQPQACGKRQLTKAVVPHLPLVPHSGALPGSDPPCTQRESQGRQGSPPTPASKGHLRRSVTTPWWCSIDTAPCVGQRRHGTLRGAPKEVQYRQGQHTQGRLTCICSSKDD